MRFGLWLGISILLVVCLFGAALWAAHTWSIETIDADGVTGATCTALDSQDYPHIAYHNAMSVLKCAYWDGSTWVRQSVDDTGILSWEVSLALDGSGYPHISYYGYWIVGEVGEQELRYARWDGTDWDDTQTVERSSNFAGMYNSIGLDAGDRPRIAYCDYTDRDLKYATWISGTTWQIQTVDSTDMVGSQCSLDLDASGNAHIAYEDLTNHCVEYAKQTGSSSWDIHTVVSNAARPSLRLDSGDYPHIAYTDYSTQDLCYVAWNGTSWDTPDTVDGSGPSAYPCLALDTTNNPAIAYGVGVVGGADVKYAEWSGTDWQIETVDAGRSSKMELWLALTSGGEPCISFLDARSFPQQYLDLLYASATGPLAVRWPR